MGDSLILYIFEIMAHSLYIFDDDQSKQQQQQHQQQQKQKLLHNPLHRRCPKSAFCRPHLKENTKSFLIHKIIKYHSNIIHKYCSFEIIYISKTV